MEVVYPSDFDLFTASDVAGVTAEFQALAAKGGSLPLTEGLMLGRLMRLCLPGLSDAHYAACDSEIQRYLAARSARLRGGEEGQEIKETKQTILSDVHVW